MKKNKSTSVKKIAKSAKRTRSTKKENTYFKIKRYIRSPLVVILLLALVGGFFWATKQVRADGAGTPEFHRGIVSISFVNGYKEQYKIAKNLLKPRGINASFYVPTENIGKKGYVSLDDLIELKSLGFEVGNMTTEDTSLLGLSKPQVLKRYADAQSWLTGNMSETPKTCLYPGGPYGNDNNALPSPILDAVTSKSLGFQGCVIGHESVMFKESYDEWKLQSIFVDQRLDSVVLIHAIRNMAGAHTWGNLRIGQIDTHHDNTDSFTTTQIMSPVFDEMVRLRTDKWIDTPDVVDSINLAKQ